MWQIGQGSEVQTGFTKHDGLLIIYLYWTTVLEKAIKAGKNYS